MLEKRKSGWWIVGVPEYFVDGERQDANGPYESKAEAADGMRGLKITLKKMAEEEAVNDRQLKPTACGMANTTQALTRGL